MIGHLQDASPGKGKICAMVTVRDANTADLSAISDLAGYLDVPAFQSFPTVVNQPVQPYRTVEWFQEQASYSNIRMFVAVNEEHKVIGFARAHIGPTPNSAVMKQQTIGWMHELVMLPGDEATQVGLALLNAIDSWLLLEGITQVRATVWPLHTDATEVFEQHGYRVMSQNMIRDLNG